jgi:rhamnose utilization protein RhaD (predicted bifunctional aldolase and dehydrogenase)
MCSKKVWEKSFELLGNDILFVEYTDPGYILFKKIADSLAVYRKSYSKDPQIILLENHGIFVSADSIKEIKDIYLQVEKIILKNSPDKLSSQEIKSFKTAVYNEIDEVYGKDIVKQTVGNDLIMEFVRDETSFETVRTAFTPDHIVYCKARYLFIDEANDQLKNKTDGFTRQYGYLPKVIGIKGKGLLIVDSSQSAVDIIRELILNMMKISFYARPFGGSKAMTDIQIAFIENWEAENYRKKMAEKGKN